MSAGSDLEELQITSYWCPASVAQLVERWPVHQGITGLISSRGTCLAVGFIPRGATWEAADPCFSLPLPPSPTIKVGQRALGGAPCPQSLL